MFGVEIKPLAIGLGAELSGVDLSQELPVSMVEQIREALLRWKVVFFRDQSLEPRDQIRFGEHFGEVLPGHPTLPGLEGHPQILPLVSRPGAHQEGHIESRWHTDVTYVEAPPMGSILRAVQVPEYGGDTQWSNLALAYERLSAPLRNLLDGLHAVHRNTIHVAREGEGGSSLRSSFSARRLAAVHPVVRVHPETGERALFVNPNFTSHIVELSSRESAGLLAMLFDHLARPELTVRFRWARGSLAFWDNRATAHHAPTDIAQLDPAAVPGQDFTRVMHRVTLAGERVVGVDGQPSRALDGDAFG